MKVEEIQHNYHYNKQQHIDKIYLPQDVMKKAEDLVFKDEGVVVVYDDNAIILDNRTFSKLHNRFKSDFINYHDFVIAIDRARDYLRNVYLSNREKSITKDTLFEDKSEEYIVKNVDTRDINEIIGEIKKIHKQIDKSLIKYKVHTKKICNEIDNLNRKYPAINNEFDKILYSLSKINNETISKAFKNISSNNEQHINIKV